MTRRALAVAGVGLILAGTAVIAGVLLPLAASDAQADTRSRAAVAALDRSWAPPRATTTTGRPPVLPAPADAAVFAVLRVPRFGTDWSRVIAQGVSASRVLDTGAVGHYPQTAMPGAIGDFAVAGHREADGAALLHLPSLRPGDEVIVDTAIARYVYRITGSAVVTPTAVAEIAPVPGHPGARPTRRLITLQTCTPPLIDTDRLVAHGELVSWQPR